MLFALPYFYLSLVNFAMHYTHYDKSLRSFYGMESKAGSPSSIRSHKPCYFYHLSSDLEDDKVVMRPRYISSTEDEVAHINRICVSPTVEQCLVAQCQYTKSLSIYRSIRMKKESWIPYGVNDAPLTQERWFLKPLTMVKVGEIELDCNHVIVRDNNGTEISDVRLNYGFRGAIQDISVQAMELRELRSMFRKHSEAFFYNKKELDIHRNQVKMNVRFNR